MTHSVPTRRSSDLTTSSTRSGSIPLRSTSAWRIVAPSSPAVREESPPPNLPTGVRRGETIAARRNCMVISSCCSDVSFWRSDRAFELASGRPQVGQVFFHQIFRSEEHTSELQSLMRISYAVFCLQKKKNYI